MQLDAVIRFYERKTGIKGTQAVCKALGVTRGAVSHWRVAGTIPLDRQRHIQLDTKGKLKVST